MILFQSSVDFGIELLGVAVPATIIASTVQLVPLRPVASITRSRLARGALVALLLGMALVLMSTSARSVEEDHDLIQAMDPPSLAQVRASIQRHPLDYFGFGRAAEVMSLQGDIHAVDYLNHALALHPSHPGLHRLAARMLVGNKRYAQAAVEYSLAMEAEYAPRALLKEIVTLIPDVDDAAAAIPSDYPNVDVMLHSLKEMNRQDISEKWLVRVANRPQHDFSVIDTLYELAMQRRDLDTAKWAASLRLSLAHTTTSRLKLAKVKFARREFDDLLKDLADVKTWNGRTDEKGQAWLLLCDVHIETRDWDGALACIHHLDVSGLVPPGGAETSRRIEIIDEQRTYDAKMHVIETLERAAGSDAKAEP